MDRKASGPLVGSVGTVPLWVFIVIAIVALIMVLSVCLTLFICFSSRNKKGVEEKKDVEKEGKENEKEEKGKEKEEKGKEKDEKGKEKDEKEKEKKSDKQKASEQPKTSENPSVPKVKAKVKPKARPKPSASLPTSGAATTPAEKNLDNLSLTSRAQVLTGDRYRGPIPKSKGLVLEPRACFFPLESQRCNGHFRILNGTDFCFVYEIRTFGDHLTVPYRFGYCHAGGVYSIILLSRAPHDYVEGECFCIIFYAVMEGGKPDPAKLPVSVESATIFAYDYPDRHYCTIQWRTIPERLAVKLPKTIDDEVPLPSQSDESKQEMNRQVEVELQRRMTMKAEGRPLLYIIAKDPMSRREQYKEAGVEESVRQALKKNTEQSGSEHEKSDKKKKKKSSSSDESEKSSSKKKSKR